VPFTPALTASVISFEQGRNLHFDPTNKARIVDFGIQLKTPAVQ